MYMQRQELRKHARFGSSFLSKAQIWKDPFRILELFLLCKGPTSQNVLYAIFYAPHIEFWAAYCLAEKENQLRWSSLSLCGKGLSVGRSRVNGRGAAVNAAGCGALRRRQCSRSPLYQPWHSFLSVPTHSYILCSTAGKLALVSFRCSFSSTFSRPC